MADAAQSVAETTSNAKEQVLSPESSTRQQAMKLVAEVESAGQELSERASDLFECLLKNVVAAENRPAQKRTKKKTKATRKTVKKKVRKKTKKVVEKLAKNVS